MKKQIILILCLFGLSTYGQITLNTSFLNIDKSYEALNMTRLSNSGYKYYRLDKVNSKLIIYNLNFTVYKIINIPLTLSTPKIYAVSEDLFDSNNTTVEFLVNDWSYVGSYFKPTVTIINETGSIIFQRDSCTITSNGATFNDPNNARAFIVRNSSGTKMILTKVYQAPSPIGDEFVYDLPGQLTCQECIGGIMSLVQNPMNPIINDDIQLQIFPNPSNNISLVQYSLPKFYQSATLVVYDSAGKEIMRYEIDGFMNKIELNNLEFNSGIYLIKIITKDGKSKTEKWVNSK